MIGWRTRPDRRNTSILDGASPSLVFHKWHAYDPPPKDPPRLPDPNFGTSSSRVEFLTDVAGRANRHLRSSSYRAWYDGYREALQSLGAVELGPFSTLGRLVSGLATNPALESGIQLHALHGFPYLPGSAVKGLVHHVAEMEIVEDERWSEALASDDPSGGGLVPGSPELLEAFLTACKRVWELFGSLTLEQGELPGGGPLGPPGPRAFLRRWRAEKRLPESPKEAADTVRERVAKLLDGHTGGRTAFYDAVPLPPQRDVIEVDLLNPHYPDYYRSEGRDRSNGRDHPPSDDQNPIPVYFLTVAPEVPFLFAYRLRQAEDGDSELVEGWLKKGLAELGAGAKTSSGYGYFEVAENTNDSEGTEQERSTVPAPEGASETWPAADLTWLPNQQRVIARWEGKEAAGEREHLEDLPEDLRDRLTGGPKTPGSKKRRKGRSIRAEVVVQVLGPSYFKIETIRAPGNGRSGGE